MSIGLDIGSKSIKMVELIGSGDGLTLRSAGAVAYTGAEIDKITDDKGLEAVGANIKKLASDIKASSNQVFLSLPESQVFTRIIKFPLLNDQEIASAVKWEAEEYIPIPIKEATIEYQIVERKESGNPPQVLVLIIAAQRTLVEKYVKVASFAGLRVLGAETELLSLSRAVAPPNRTAVVVDLGARSSDIAIVKNSQVFFTRSLTTGGDVFSRAIAQSLGVQPAQAEEYKKAYGIDPSKIEGKVGNAIVPTLKTITEEIRKAIHFYQNESFGDAPTITIVSGGSSGMPGLIQEMAKTIGTEVIIGNSFGKIRVDQVSMQSLANYQQIYGVAAGLAMRSK